MADDHQDPPWGRPLEEGEQASGDDQSTEEQATPEDQSTMAHDAPPDDQTVAHTEPDNQDTGLSQEPETVATAEGEGESDAQVTAEPERLGGAGDGVSDDPEEYQWHTGLKREHGSTDAVEFIDVVKSSAATRSSTASTLASRTTRSR